MRAGSAKSEKMAGLGSSISPIGGEFKDRVKRQIMTKARHLIMWRDRELEINTTAKIGFLKILRAWYYIPNTCFQEKATALEIQSVTKHSRNARSNTT